jgi:hypothetical protein
MESSAYTAVKTAKCFMYGFLFKAAILKPGFLVPLINLFKHSLSYVPLGRPVSGGLYVMMGSLGNLFQ